LSPFSGTCIKDVVFILDDSGSITDPALVNIANWNLAKQFMKTVVTTSLHVSYYWDRVALVTFSDSASLIFDLNDEFTFGNVLNAVDGAVYVGGNTNTPVAIQVN